MHPESKHNLAVHPLPYCESPQPGRDLGRRLAALAAAKLRPAWRAIPLPRRAPRQVLLFGSGVEALALLPLLRDPETGYRALGYLDARRAPAFEAATGLAWLGPLDALAAVLAANVVDEVFVALPDACHRVADIAPAAARALQCCAEQGIRIHVPLDLPACDPRRASLSAPRGWPMMTLAPAAESRTYQCVKRGIDVAVAASLLLLLAPLLLTVMVLIRIDSPGPALFVQRRVGLTKRLFPLLKFRTMRVNSEAERAALVRLNEVDGPVFKIRNDPRVTRLGRLLRRTSIDELPQLLNVLAGHMSLVGPRPLPLADVAGFTSDWQRRRFAVRPGITCLWQISGRSGISFEEWMRLDMFYIDHRCLRLDLEILLKTIPAVMTLAGAY